MIWIKSVKLENFESHKDTFVELHSGFNIFTGSSNSGKSSVIRGIRWLAFNEPGGDKFIRKDEDYIEEQSSSKKRKKRTVTKVVVELSNGYKIERAKNRGAGTLNRYSLWAPGEEDPIEFDRFGTEVPDEVRQALGFGYIKSGNKKLEVNYLSQFETPRALAYQGASLSNMINKLNNLDEFEEALNLINSKIHFRGEISTKEKVIQEHLDEARRQLEKTVDNSNELEFLKEEILPKLKYLKSIDDKIIKAKSYIDRASKIKSSLINNKKEIDSIPDIDLASEKLQSVTSLLNKINSANNYISRFNKIEIDINKKQENIITVSNQVSSLEDESHKYILNILNSNNQCPMCHQELNEDSIQKTIRYLTSEE